MRRTCGIGLGLGLLLAGLGTSQEAQGQAAPDRHRSSAYYGAQAGALTALFGGGVALTLLPERTKGADPCWFPGDVSLRGRSSTSAARVSDTLLALTVALPLGAAAGRGASPRLLNTTLVYGDALAANLLLVSLSKAVLHRPRPYTYRHPPETPPDDDFYVSFYSGHASTSLTAAVAGAYLFGESAPDRTSRALVWGSEAALASATTVLRLRAGKHYYSDVLVGALVGIGLGAATPVALGGRYLPSALDLGAAAGGLSAGVLTAALFPFSQDEAPGRPSFALVPGFAEGAPQLAATGRF